MSGAPVQTAKGGKKADGGSLAKVWISALFNIALGVLIAFAVLTITLPKPYDAKPPKPGDPPPAPPAGVWFWEGKKSGGGDWRAKEAVFLAAAGPVAFSEAELNAWASANLKGASRPPARPAAPGAAPEGPMFEFAPGTLNFRSWSADPAAPAYFQVALPVNLSLLGHEFVIVYQARGVFKPTGGGPVFEPFYTAVGSARVPAAGGLGKLVFNRVVSAMASGDNAKKYVDAWGKYSSATPTDAGLALQN